jgi:anaerobic dimethyl sulfoxide reductase subunit A
MGNTTYGIIGKGAGPLPMWVPGIYGTFYDPRTKDYPLVLLTTESRFRTHSAYFTNPFLNGDCYRHACWLNPSDAKARGIVDGDLVRVYSNRGEMVIEAYVTSRILPGVTAVHHGGWYMPNSTKTALSPDGIDRGGAPNLILEDVEPDMMTIGPSLDKGVCEVEKF